MSGCVAARAALRSCAFILVLSAALPLFAGGRTIVLVQERTTRHARVEALNTLVSAIERATCGDVSWLPLSSDEAPKLQWRSFISHELPHDEPITSCLNPLKPDLRYLFVSYLDRSDSMLGYQQEVVGDLSCGGKRYKALYLNPRAIDSRRLLRFVYGDLEAAVLVHEYGHSIDLPQHTGLQLSLERDDSAAPAVHCTTRGCVMASPTLVGNLRTLVRRFFGGKRIWFCAACRANFECCIRVMPFAASQEQNGFGTHATVSAILKL